MTLETKSNTERLLMMCKTVRFSILLQHIINSPIRRGELCVANLLQVSRPLDVNPTGQVQIPEAALHRALAVVQVPLVSPAATPVHRPPSLFPGAGRDQPQRPSTLDGRYGMHATVFWQKPFSCFAEEGSHKMC